MGVPFPASLWYLTHQRQVALHDHCLLSGSRLTYWSAFAVKMSLTVAEKKEFVKLVCLCLLWYAISSANNVVGKTLLNYFPYPNTLSMVQLLSITVYSEPVLRCLRIRPHAEMSWSYYASVIVPLATGKFLAVLFSHISIWKVPLSYAHTGKLLFPKLPISFLLN